MSQPHRGDIELSRGVSEGSLDAWHRFIENYSGLIYGVLRRHLYAEDEDDVRTVHVDILEALYRGDIAKYRGDATLATWLIVYARSRALDFLRRRYGRRRAPKWQENLSELDRDVLRLFFIERLPLSSVVHGLAWSGHRVSAEEIIEAIGRIEVSADPGCLARLEKDASSRSLGMRHPRMLDWMGQARLEDEERIRKTKPDAVLAEKEAQQIAERVRQAIENLPDRDREVVSLRFEKGMTAAGISSELGLGGERRAYTAIERIVRTLRRIVLENKDA